MLPSAGSSPDDDDCGFAIDADDSASARDAGDALIAALDDVLDLDLEDKGCDEWRVDLAGMFELEDALLWNRTEDLVLAGPEDGAPARLLAVPFGAPPADVTHRILTATPGSGGSVGDVTIERLILEGGAVEAVTGDDLGGAVLADVVHLVDSELVGNSAVGGGAVAADAVHAERVSFVENATPTGAGGAIAATGALTLTNVTFARNIAAAGGAVRLGPDVSLEATFVTFLDNASVGTGAGDDLHVVAASAGSISLRGVLFGGTGSGPACGGDGFPDDAVDLDVEGSFAVDDASCTGVTEIAGPLTFTTVPFLTGMAELPVPDGGPAEIGQVACGAGWPAVDQRGVTRPQGDTCDAGAVEREVVVVPPPPAPEAAPPPTPEVQQETAVEDVVDGPVPTSVPAGDGTCADGCPAFGAR